MSLSLDNCEKKPYTRKDNEKNERNIRGVRMELKIVIPVLVSFAISVLLGPVIIPFLRKLKMGQTERVDGVQSHLKRREHRLWAA